MVGGMWPRCLIYVLGLMLLWETLKKPLILDISAF